jgi:hypothetical protein
MILQQLRAMFRSNNPGAFAGDDDDEEMEEEED